ncbi:hypothetical protein [Actinomadura gamaensis]|uniref:Uncharacterized protein n=1 Tax=Actinomadura gamaensis TaxID=1763541 RepID=A0ABV9UFY7_9ACTN
MIPHYSIEVSGQIPAEASFWMPSEEEYEEAADFDGEGFGFFHDTWILEKLTSAEAAAIVREERELLPLVDRYSSTPEQFEETVSSLENPDLPDCQPRRLWGTPLWGQIVDPTGGSVEPRFGGLEFGVAGLSFALNSLGFVPVASCRAHFGQSWADSPVVFFAAPRVGAQWLQPLVERTGCGFDIDSFDRPQFLATVAPSIAHSIALAEAVLMDASNAPRISFG